MVATAINHVSLPVDDLDKSAAFYRDVLGLERIPAIDGSARGAWFAIGDAQLHLTERGSSAPPVHHFAVTVDDLPSLVRALDARDALEAETFGAPIYEMPDGAVQVYFRDPSGNLLEADWPDVSTLPADLRERAATREAVLGADRSAEARRATLFPE